MSIVAGEEILIVNETLTIDGTATSTDNTSGALIVAGGVGIGGDTNIGGNVKVDGTTNLVDTLTIGTGTTSYSFPTERSGTGTILSFSTTAGALEFSNLNVLNAINNFGTDNRLLKTSGTGTNVEATGMSLSDNDDLSGVNSIDVTTNSTFGGELNINGTASSTDTTSGTLVVAGGVGIGENLNVAGDLVVEGLTCLESDLKLGSGTTSYTFPTEAGLPGQVLTMNTSGALVFATCGASSFCVNAPNTWGTDNRLVRTLGTDRDVEATNIIVSDNDDISNINTISVNGDSTIGGTLYLTSTASSTDNTSGALVISGGVGIAENLNVGGDTNLGGQVTITDTTQSNDSTSGALIVDGGVGIGGNLNVAGTISADGLGLNGDLAVTSTTASNDNTSGALVVAGGVGISGDTNIGGNTNVDGDLNVDGVTTITDTTSSTNNTTGALVIAGGLGLAENLNMGGVLNVNNTTSSTSPDSGAVVVDGGAGIAENLNVGGDINADGQVNVDNTANATGTGTGALVVDGGASITKDLYIGGSLFLEEPLVSASQFFNAYHTTTVDVSSTTFSALQWDTEIRKDTGLYSHAAASADVDVLESGWYEITANIATEITTGNGTNRTISSARITINGVPVTGSTSYMYNRTAERGQGTCTITILQNLTVNDTINVEINRLVGNSTVTSVASACRLFVSRV